MISNNNLYEIQTKMFNIFIYLSYVLILLSCFGLFSNYLEILDYYIRVYICLFLIWRFHPFKKKYEFNDLDRKIAFSAGCIILTTTFINAHLNNIKNYIKNILINVK
jgi:hypothetical protein